MPRIDRIKKSIDKLNQKLQKETKIVNISFGDFLDITAENPERSLRNIFQLFHDMIHYYIPQGINEYPNDPESINYIRYDCEKLFVEETDNPFFADRLLANRLVSVVDSLKEGVVRNKMLLFVGPPGSGKSTFINNLLQKLERFTELEEGVMYETVWQIDTHKFGFPYSGIGGGEGLLAEVLDAEAEDDEISAERFTDRYLLVPCPSHDHPIVQVPKKHRRELLDELIEDKVFKRTLFHHKEYEWVFKDSPCPVCSSIYRALSERFTPDEILEMLYARRYEFSRKLGEGVSVYNPGDKVLKMPLQNKELQKWINALFKSSDAVSFTHSRMAKTNNGIFVVMDAKVSNVERLKNIHGIISDGIHKVGTFEESINSLFLTLINPEDISVINEEKSFRDRVIKIPIPYVRDYKTEVQIYRNIFGGGIDKYFLPRILMAFARVVVSTRLNRNSPAMKEWIAKPEKYSKFCDKNLLLLKMEIYTGFIPEWLSEEDVKRLDRQARRSIIMEGDEEGKTGFSGRESLEMFNSFYARYRNRDDLINIENMVEFFSQSEYMKKIPDDLLEASERLYDYAVLQEVKESMFFYNKDQIANDISDYLFAINHEMGSDIESPFTGNMLGISEPFLNRMEARLIKGSPGPKEFMDFRSDALRHYVAKTLHEVKAGMDIADTEQFQSLLKKYYQNLKENVLKPFVSNENFRRAIKDYGDESFKNYDKRIREEVKLLIKNLIFKFGYTEKGAKQVCIYVIDRKLADKFKE